MSTQARRIERVEKAIGCMVSSIVSLVVGAAVSNRVPTQFAAPVVYSSIMVAFALFAITGVLLFGGQTEGQTS